MDLSNARRDALISSFNAAAGSIILTPALYADNIEGLETAKVATTLHSLFPSTAFDFVSVQAASLAAVASAVLSGSALLTPVPTRAADALGAANTAGYAVGVLSDLPRVALFFALRQYGLIVAASASAEDGDADARVRKLLATLTPRAAANNDESTSASYSSDPSSAPPPPIALAICGATGEADASAFSAAGARVVLITDSLCVSAAYIAARAAGGGVPPPPATRLRIVVPMAGLGSRFATDGFVIQKPFLPTIGGAQLWELVVENLMPKEEPLRSATEVHIVVRPDQLEHFRKAPHVTLHTVPGMTEGPACTVLSLTSIINDDTPLVIGNLDQVIEWDSDTFYAAAFHPDFDGAISTFYHPRPDDLTCSYARLKPDGTVDNVAEKVYVGPFATSGLYAFKKGRDFVAAAQDMIARNERSVNNEFSCCPAFNNAMRAGLKYRIVNCAKFWGVSAPLDLAAFLDKYVPPGPPRPFGAQLARRYAAMRCKWAPRLPVPQPDVASDMSKCTAMWSTGAFALTPAYWALREALEPYSHAAQWYDVQESLGLAPQGGPLVKPASFAAAAAVPRTVLHHSFFQFQNFPVTATATETEADARKWAAAAQTAMAKLPPYYLKLRGPIPVRSGIVAAGYPPTDYASVRSAIRSAAPCREPHAQDIHHVTLLRWTAALTPQDARAVAIICSQFEHELLGTFQPSAWHVGLATRCVRPETVVPLVSWRAPPSPWVLHRGNTAGLAPETENSPSLIKRLLSEGWDVAIELWRAAPIEAAALAAKAAAEHAAAERAGAANIGERVKALTNFAAQLAARLAAMPPIVASRPALWLGHDAPAFSLSADDIEGLLAAPGVWIHAKHLASFTWLRGHPRSVDFNFFSHDKDDVALTSSGYAWGYPDVAVPGPGTVSVVWPKEKTYKVRPGVGVCWDYLPRDVALVYE